MSTEIKNIKVEVPDAPELTIIIDYKALGSAGTIRQDINLLDPAADTKGPLAGFFITKEGRDVRRALEALHGELPVGATKAVYTLDLDHAAARLIAAWLQGDEA